MNISLDGIILITLFVSLNLFFVFIPTFKRAGKDGEEWPNFLKKYGLDKGYFYPHNFPIWYYLKPIRTLRRENPIFAIELKSLLYKHYRDAFRLVFIFFGLRALAVFFIIALLMILYYEVISPLLG